MRILALNQYGEADASPTARLLHDLATYLRGQGHEVEVIAVAADYQQGPKAGASRWKRELGALLHMRRAGRAATKPDLVLSFSSPPLLAVIGDAVARYHRVPHVHWALDLYPDLAKALGANPSKLIDTASRFLMRRAYQNCQRLITLDDDMAATLRQGYGVNASTTLPWPPLPCPEDLQNAAALDSVLPEPPTWLYSGNLGRAHAWEPLVAIQAELERRGSPARLVLQGSGYGRPLLQAAAQEQGLKQMDVRDYAPEEKLLTSLMAARVLVVTMKPEVRGLLWPSKLALALLTGRPLLFLGPKVSVPAQQVQQAGGGVFAPNETKSAAAWLVDTLSSPPASGRTGQMESAIQQCRLERIKRLTGQVIGEASGQPGNCQ